MKTCQDCGTDISHRGARAERCERCAEKRIRERYQKPEHKEKERARKRELYQNDPEYKRQKLERQRQRRNDPVCRERIKEQDRRYKQTPEVRKRKRERERTPEYREKKNKRDRTPEYKEKKNKRDRTLKYKEKKNKRDKERYQRLGGRGYRRAWPDLLLRDGPVCGICGGNLDPIREDFHVDHIRPAAHGGNSDLSNLQLAHPFCNERKNTTWDGTLSQEPPVQLPLFG